MLRYIPLLFLVLCMGTGNLLANEPATPANDSHLAATDSEIILPNDEIKKLYSDYIREKLNEEKEIGQEQIDALCIAVDSALTSYIGIPNCGNNTVRKFKVFKKWDFFKKFELNYNYTQNESIKNNTIRSNNAKIDLVFYIYFNHNIPTIEQETRLELFQKNLTENYLKAQIDRERQIKPDHPFDISEKKNEIEKSAMNSIRLLMLYSTPEFAARYLPQNVLEKIENLDCAYFGINKSVLSKPLTKYLQACLTSAKVPPNFAESLQEICDETTKKKLRDLSIIEKERAVAHIRKFKNENRADRKGEK